MAAAPPKLSGRRAGRYTRPTQRVLESELFSLDYPARVRATVQRIVKRDESGGQGSPCPDVMVGNAIRIKSQNPQKKPLESDQAPASQSFLYKAPFQGEVRWGNQHDASGRAVRTSQMLHIQRTRDQRLFARLRAFAQTQPVLWAAARTHRAICRRMGRGAGRWNCQLLCDGSRLHAASHSPALGADSQAVSGGLDNLSSIDPPRDFGANPTRSVGRLSCSFFVGSASTPIHPFPSHLCEDLHVVLQKSQAAWDHHLHFANSALAPHSLDGAISA
jgi:hypothetical protein